MEAAKKNKMKVIFVGMHNKPDMKPLDSKTMTGKVIDSMIEILGYDRCVKTNLCDCDYLPDIGELSFRALEWHSRINPMPDDVIVLLGRWVQDNFRKNNWCKNIVHLTHPAGIYGTKNKAEYIQKSIQKILSLTDKK